ncbi:MAG: SulP family inorganic anion transporter, partial [Actinobacteria bacterium]
MARSNNKTPVSALAHWMPGVSVALHYRREDLVADLVAGLVLAGLMVPQGMAYAQLAGLPPITGLYTSVAVLLGYALFGPSRRLVLGPDSSLGPLIAASIVPLAAGDPQRAVALAGMLGLMVGAIGILLGTLRLGFVADLLSKPVRVGYLCGVAVLIFVGQLPKLLGFSVHAEGVGGQLLEIAGSLPAIVPASAAVGIGVVATILLLGRFFPRAPGVLIAVVGASLITVAFDLAARGVAVVGALPQGVPHPALPLVARADLVPLLLAAAGIALVALADSISTAASFAARIGDDVHADRELIGLGVANVFAGLFQGFPASASGSRTAVAEQAGARTELAPFSAGILMIVLLVAAPGLTAYLPQPALAGVVIVASLLLFDYKQLGRLYRVRRSEFLQALTALLGVVVLGVLPGLGLAIVVSVLNFFRRAWWPHDAVLGRVDGLAGFHDLKFYPNAHTYPGLIIYRFDAPLFFANARAFHDR